MKIFIFGCVYIYEYNILIVCTLMIKIFYINNITRPHFLVKNIFGTSIMKIGN